MHVLNLSLVSSTIQQWGQEWNPGLQHAMYVLQLGIDSLSLVSSTTQLPIIMYGSEGH